MSKNTREKKTLTIPCRDNVFFLNYSKYSKLFINHYFLVLILLQLQRVLITILNFLFKVTLPVLTALPFIKSIFSQFSAISSITSHHLFHY